MKKSGMGFNLDSGPLVFKYSAVGTIERDNQELAPCSGTEAIEGVKRPMVTIPL